MVQGMSARLAGRWEIAERAFRAVTALQPSYVGAWLELTVGPGIARTFGRSGV